MADTSLYGVPLRKHSSVEGAQAHESSGLGDHMQSSGEGGNLGLAQD